MEVNFLTFTFSFSMLMTLARTLSLTGQSLHFNSIRTSITSKSHKYTGLWVTIDGYIRQELFADGRYNEARGNKESAYKGRYEIRGNHIKYRDDTGFTASGDFNGSDKLYHGGYIFYRERPRDF